jgi:hypothetical protein
LLEVRAKSNHDPDQQRANGPPARTAFVRAGEETMKPKPKIIRMRHRPPELAARDRLFL